MLITFDQNWVVQSFVYTGLVLLPEEVVGNIRLTGLEWSERGSGQVQFPPGLSRTTFYNGLSYLMTKMNLGAKCFQEYNFFRHFQQKVS